MYKAIVALILVAQTVFAQDSFKCPHEYGFYPHTRSCDKYWKCENNVAELKTCGNGLAFDATDSKFLKEDCDYLHNVDCGDRTELEPAVSTPNCPRLYGIFPDETRCDTFWSCWNGEASKYTCAPGLAYDADARVCMWADQVPECKISQNSSGFKCPNPKDNPNPGTFSRHAHPEDCRKYYVCLDGNPREYGCPIGTVYKIGGDEFSGQCEDPEGVEGCENYYGDDLKGIKKSELLLGSYNDGDYNRGNKGSSKPNLRKKIPQTPKPEVQSAPSQQSQVTNNRVQQLSHRDRVRPAAQPVQQTQQVPQAASRPSQPQRVAQVTTTRPTTSTSTTAKSATGDKASADDYYYYDENYDENTPANNNQRQPQ